MSEANKTNVLKKTYENGNFVEEAFSPNDVLAWESSPLCMHRWNHVGKCSVSTTSDFPSDVIWVLIFVFFY
jgi:hypothetical protein